MKKRRRKIWISILFLTVLIAGGVMVQELGFQKELHAQSQITTEDMEIKDFEWRCNTSQSVICEGYAIAQNGEVYYSENVSIHPFTQVVLRNGEPLRNIEKVILQNEYYDDVYHDMSNMPVILIQEDGTIYGKGDEWGGWGDHFSPNRSYFSPFSINLGSPVKDIKLGTTNGYFLLENGELYSTGNDRYGGRGGAGMQEENNEGFSKVYNVPEIKQIEVNHNNAYALDTTGKVWSWGQALFGRTGSAMNLNVPTKLMNSDTSEFDIPVLYLGSADVSMKNEYGEGMGLVLMGENKRIYYICTYEIGIGNHDLNLGPLSQTPQEIEVLYPEFTGNISKLSYTLNNVSLVDNNTYYAMVSSGTYNEYDSTSNVTDLREQMHPYSSEAAGVNATTSVLSAASINNHTYIIKEENKKLYIDGVPAQFVVELTIEASIGADHAEYASGDKYHDAVTLAFNVAQDNQNAIRYKIAEQSDMVFGEEQVVTDYNNFTINVAEGEHVHRTYRMYLDGKETSTAQDIVVDLYKNSFEDVSVADEGIYDVDTSLTWDESNGLEGNHVKATLTNESGIDTTISLNHTLSEEGSYQLTLEDDYGNKYQANFQIGSTDGLTFTPMDTLEFGNEFTVESARLGTLSIEQEAIIEGSITGGDEQGNFTIDIDQETNQAYIKAVNDILAGEYTLTISGKDANGTDFENKSISFTVAKANVTLEWSEDVETAIRDGLYFSDEFQATISNVPQGITIRYTLEEAVEGVSVDDDGTLCYDDITQNSVTVKLKAAPEESTNYEIEPITMEVTIQKRALELKTTIQNGTSYGDSYDLVIGSTLPAFRVEQTGTVMESVPQPTSYQYITEEQTPVTELNQLGSYQIKPVYTTDVFKLYNVTWTYAQLHVQELAITDTTASQFYTLSLDDQNHTAYTEGTWATSDIIITQKHPMYNRMRIDDGELSTSAYHYRVPGEHEVTLEFCDTDNTCVQTSVSLKYDATPPEITGTINNVTHIYYHHTRTIQVQDTGSGIAEIILTDLSGSRAVNSPIEIDQAGLYRIKAKDEAGNESTVHFVLIALPNMDEIDSSDASYQIIQEIIAESDDDPRDDELDHLEYEDWISDALEKWQEHRVMSLIAEDQNGKMESLYEQGFDPALKLIVENVDIDSLPTLPEDVLDAFHVYLTRETREVVPNGNVKVYLPYTETEPPIVYQIDEQNHEVMQIPSEKEGEYVSFTVTRLMTYAIANKAQEVIQPNLCVVGPDTSSNTSDDVCGKPNKNGENPVKKPNGSIEVPKGGSVVFPKDKVLELTDGGIINPDGSVVLPNGMKYDADGNKIKEPSDDNSNGSNHDNSNKPNDDNTNKPNHDNTSDPQNDPNDDNISDPQDDNISDPNDDKTNDDGTKHPDDNTSSSDPDDNTSSNDNDDTSSDDDTTSKVGGANTGTQDFSIYMIFLCFAVLSFTSICMYRYKKC